MALLLCAATLAVGVAPPPTAGAASGPNFVVSAIPATATVVQGESTTVVVTVLGEHSYDGPSATVTVANPPFGLTTSCAPNPVPRDTSCSLALAAWPNATSGTYSLRVDADNGTAVRSTTITLTIHPAPAVSLALGTANVSLGPGESKTVNASVTFTGPPGSVANLTVSFPQPGFLDVAVAPGTLASSGNATITVTSLDNATTQLIGVVVVARVLSASESRQFDVQAVNTSSTGNNGTGSGSDNPSTPGTDNSGLPPWLLPLLVVAVLAGGLGLVVAFRRRRPLGAAAGESPREAYLVEDVFLLYNDGRTLFSRTGLGGDDAPDPELVGSMLVAIQDFVRDSFSKGAGVDHMSYGDNAVLLERGAHVILAVTIFGKPGEELRDLMREAVGATEAQYAGVIEKWDGDRTALAGAEEVLRPLWAPTAGLTRGEVTHALTAKEVQVLSGVEFYQGFVRLKVAVQNNTEEEIGSVSVAIDHSAEVLRLDHVEPETLSRNGSTVLVGPVRPGDRTTIAFYFDPQICTSSSLEGVARYTSHDGAQHEALMKPRRAEVVCPLFFTPGQANTATLRRLVEEQLREFDVRAFALPTMASDLDLSQLFASLKAAVSAHDVLEVRSHESWRPYSGRAWYYGRTQKGQEMVIRAAVDETSGRAEFYVAARSMRAVTGLLAELSHTLRRGSRSRGAKDPLDPVHDPGVQSAYRDLQMVSRMIEAELEAGDTAQ